MKSGAHCTQSNGKIFISIFCLPKKWSKKDPTKTNFNFFFATQANATEAEKITVRAFRGRLPHWYQDGLSFG